METAMSRHNSESLTEREAQIMDVVWRLGEVTAEQVREALPGAPHDSTVRTLMRVLEKKGYLTHEIRGKAYVHRALVGRQKAQKIAVRSVLTRFFAGSAEDLVLRLIEDEHLSPKQLDELRRSATSPTSPKRPKKGETP
jgi:BlaI family transcriptional regulator, penicillinase repressor